MGVALECPSWPVVVVVGVGRWGRLVGGEDLRATVHLGYVPSLGVILSLHLLDVVADIACDVVVVNLEKSGHAVGIGGLDYLHLGNPNKLIQISVRIVLENHKSSRF